MQQFTIGRGDDCRIRIQDNSQRVSRNHATLKVTDNGKIFITDHSSNGTFVNGIKISQNVDFPVKRGDSISFANAAELNWELIPKKSNKIIFYSIFGVVLIAICVVAGNLWFNREPNPSTEIESVLPDSTEIKKKVLERDRFVEDSIKQVKQDSINRAKDKQLEEANRKLKANEAQAKKPQEPEKPKEDSTAKTKPQQIL